MTIERTRTGYEILSLKSTFVFSGLEITGQLLAMAHESGWIEILANIVEQEQDASTALGIDNRSSTSRRVTRPPNVRGSHSYRAALREQELQEQASAETSAPQHTVADARACLARLREARAKQKELTVLKSGEEPETCTSLVLDSGKHSGTVLQQQISMKLSSMTLAKLLAFLPETKEEARNDHVSALLHDVGRPVTSRKAAAARYSEAATTVGRQTQRCGGGLINISGMMWGHLLETVSHRVQSRFWRPLLFIKKRRYDETPSKIKVPVKGAKADNKLAKILQSECQIFMLLYDNESDELISCHGHWPTWLQAIDRGTAETLRQKVIPHLHSVSRLFEMPLNLINTDRFSANFRCEKAMQADNPHYIKSHYGCDHHAVATVLGKVFGMDKPQSHISAMIAGALSLVDANSIESLREAMAACISQKLRIRPGLPPRWRRPISQGTNLPNIFRLCA